MKGKDLPEEIPAAVPPERPLAQPEAISSPPAAGKPWLESRRAEIAKTLG